MINNSITQAKETQSLINPSVALGLLKAGNERFVTNQYLNRNMCERQLN